MRAPFSRGCLRNGSSGISGNSEGVTAPVLGASLQGRSKPERGTIACEGFTLLLGRWPRFAAEEVSREAGKTWIRSLGILIRLAAIAGSAVSISGRIRGCRRGLFPAERHQLPGVRSAIVRLTGKRTKTPHASSHVRA
jgi:hypothetical protein